MLRPPRLPVARLCALCCLVPLLGSGCASPGQRQLQGRWLGNRVENVDDRMRPAATGWARGTSFEFVGSRVTVAIPAEEPRSGSYEVLNSDGSDLAIAVHGEGDAIYEARFALEGADSLRWDVGDGRTVVFTREH